MRQRTRSRSRAQSQVSASGEEEDIALGLRRFLDKLRQYQPPFTEEDVAAIPFPADNGSSCLSSSSSSAPVSPRLSPSHLEKEEFQAQQYNRELASSFPPPQTVVEKKSKELSSQLAKAVGTNYVGSSSIDLDAPLSSALFVTAVNLFDAKMLAKSKRVATDALRLVRQAYSFIWKDTDYLATLMSGEPYHGSNGSTASQRRHGAVSSPDTPVGRWNSHGNRRVDFVAAAPCPVNQPNRQLALLLDECICTLLVYANVSVNFCRSVSTNFRVLLLLSFVCCAARRLEEEDEVPYGEGRGFAADIIVGNRNLHTELDSLGQVWHGCGIEDRVLDALHECYLIDFLLDAALPPSVCSSRYDGLLTAVFEKKRRIISDVIASRGGFAHMMRAAPLRGLCGLANMSAFGDAKLRVRLLDKMAAEGVVERLANEIAFAMTAILSVDSTVPPSRSPSKRSRSHDLSWETSPPCQRSRASTSRLLSRDGSLGSAQLPHASDRDARQADGIGMLRVYTELDRILNTQPTPVERIGQCVDILMLLSSPNLCPPEISETPPASPRTSASSSPATVRAAMWASHEAALHEISLHLLAICFLAKSHARYAELTSLQLYAADCVLQWAAYSGKFYTLIVHALDELLDMMGESEGSEAASLTLSPLPPSPTSRSPSRSPSSAKKEAAGAAVAAAAAPGHLLLRRLLPGDETGLLPLLTNLLRYNIHAEANSKSIQRWFSFLADRVLPNVFEAPQLTAGRRSTSEWGRQRLQENQELRKQHAPASQNSSRASSLPPPSTLNSSASLTNGEAHGINPPVLARDLTRAEVVAVAPYFRFVRQVVEETSWRAGTAGLLGKVVLLAFNVIVTQSHCCNLVFGQACACYDAAAPLLLAMQGEKVSPRGSWWSSVGRVSTDGSNASNYRCSAVLLHQLRLEEEEAGHRQSVLSASKETDRSPSGSERRDLDPDRDEQEVFIESAAKRRSPSNRARRQGSRKKGSFLDQPSPSSATAVDEGENAGLSPFITSPCGPLAFYEPYSPSTVATWRSRSNSEEGRSPSDQQHRGSNLKAALEEAATPPLSTSAD